MDMQQQDQAGYGNEQQAIPPGLAFAQAAKELMEAALSMQENPEVQSFIKASYGKLQAMCGKAYPDAGLQWKEGIGAGKEEKDLDEEMDLDEDLDEAKDLGEDLDEKDEKSMDYEDGDAPDEESSSDMVSDDSDDDASMDEGDDDMADDEDADKEETEGDEDDESDEEDEDEEDEDEENMDDETKKLVKRLSDSVKQTSRNIEAVNKSISSLSGRIS